MRNALIGTIVEAGTDSDGNVRLIIHTEEADLKQLDDLPLYTPALIRIERIRSESELEETANEGLSAFQNAMDAMAGRKPL